MDIQYCKQLDNYIPSVYSTIEYIQNKTRICAQRIQDTSAQC